MSEFDADLKQMFAQSREDFDGAAFRNDVEQKIARARKVGYATDIVLVLVIGLVALVGAPAILNILVTVATDFIGTNMALDATQVGAWATAAAVSAAALVWVRV